MNFIESGAQHDKVILLLHGGGLAPWNYVEEAALLQEKYHILLPVLNGHNRFLDLQLSRKAASL